MVSTERVSYVLDFGHIAKLQRHYRADYEKLAGGELKLTQRRDEMLLWGKRTLGFQLGLHSSSPQSSMLDSDQLAWSLAILLQFDESLTVNLENRDFVKQALHCLFSTQKDGTWRHYKPLFHYVDVGNAYCYVFETFAALLRSALQPGDRAEMIRELLKPHCENLLDLWRYAESTKIDLLPYLPKTIKRDSETSQVYGWCSSHRTNVTEPESWATASVFSYAQALRRLLGIWSREEALRSLNTPVNRSTPAEAAKLMPDRGRTWESRRAPVSEQLWTMFINPVRMHDCDDRLEPDSQPIERQSARSAILFGPPGTSKTTLVSLLADVIGWDYVELHASHFVAEGLAAVQKTADKIFKQLLELNHTVVLFDEIDELVREREMEEDAFGRFLTTSMLPKLAELWKGRKILYFVATNHINYFDSAIIRSHRFDALILVGPPSFEAKVERIEHLLPEKYKGLKFDTGIKEQIRKEFDELLKSAPKSDNGSDQDRVAIQQAYKQWLEQRVLENYYLAKFLLLRYDELDELAYHLEQLLKKEVKPTAISEKILRQALGKVDDAQWRKNKSYSDYARDEQSARRDYQMLKTWEVVCESVKGHSPDVTAVGDRCWLTRRVDSLSDIQIEGCELEELAPASVRILAALDKLAK